MARDLVDSFNDNYGDDCDNFCHEADHFCGMNDHHHEGFSGFDAHTMGMAMTFGDLLSDDNIDIDTLLECMELETLDDFSGSLEEISFQDRGIMEIPDFEQHVYNVCGVYR